tara:strand:+ start:5892 stop:6089 length:198 start_codon:yes stop_codon:yes gene_type:complete
MTKRELIKELEECECSDDTPVVLSDGFYPYLKISKTVSTMPTIPDYEDKEFVIWHMKGENSICIE